MAPVDEVASRSRAEAMRRYADLVKLTGLANRCIDRAQERRLLEDGLTKFDLTLDEARGAMRGVAEDKGYVFESETGLRAKQVLARHAGKKGKVSRAQFRQTAALLRDFSDSKITEADAQRQLKQIMIEAGWKPRRAGLFRSRRWYNKVAV